jgi:TonB family protein
MENERIEFALDSRSEFKEIQLPFIRNIMKTIYIALLLAVTSAYSQTGVIEARPEVGWDSLKTLFVYPEIARRAGVEDASRVSVTIDTLGQVTDVEFAGAGIFSQSVKSVVRSAKWIPEMENGKPRVSQVVFDVQFQLKNKKLFPKRRVLTIESTNPAIRK